MAITEVSKDGTLYFDVYVDVKSKENPKKRVQKRLRFIKTRKEAVMAERELYRLAAVELAHLENLTITWDELLEVYELTQRQGSRTVAKRLPHVVWDQVALLRRFTGDWLKRDCKSITPGDVRRVINGISETEYSRSILRSIKSAINSVFRFGIEEGHLPNVQGSPAQTITVPKYVDDKPPQILGMSEIHRLLAHAKQDQHPWYPIWFVALNTGMRSGELFALLWTDVDWEKRLITVSKSWTARLKTVKSTKAGYWRKVPINAELLEMLKELRDRTPIDQPHVLPRVPRWKNGEAAKFLREYCEQIGITSVNFHALRACFATHLLSAGVSSPVVKKICGWTEEKVMNRYIRLAGIDVDGATEKLGFANTGAQTPEKKVAGVISLREARALKRGAMNPTKSDEGEQ